MPANAITAVSFDLWDTLVVDGSDEPKRTAGGQPVKREERRQLVWQALARHGDLSRHEVALAYDAVDAASSKVWHDQHVTWTVRERLSVLLKALKRELPEQEMDALVHAHEVMELAIPPDPIAGAAEALAVLSQRYQLCIISDAIFTPGKVLRRILAHHRLAHYFHAFVFSDEVGRSKPHGLPFAAAAQALGVDTRAMAHVGDRQHNDIAGAQAAGMRAVLLTVARDSDRAHTTADAICESYPELPGIIDLLRSKT